MDEKKSIKVSAGTAVCIFVIILLIVALGVVYYLGFVKNNEKISELETKTIALENDKAKLEQEKQANNLQNQNEEKTQSQEQIKTSKFELVYKLAMEELYEYDLLYLDDGTKIKPNSITITDISIMEGEEFTEALNKFSESEKKNIELLGSIDYTLTYPDEYEGKGSRAGSKPPHYFIVSKLNGEYKIEIATGL